MRTRWLVLSIWIALTIAGGVLGGQVFDEAAQVDELSASAEAMRADARLNAIEPQGPVLFAITKDQDPFDPELVASVEAVTKALQGLAKVESIYNTPGGGIGSDTRSTLIRAELTDLKHQDQVVAELRKIKAPRVLIGGESLAEQAFADQAVQDAAIGESVALVVLLGLLFVIFRRVVPVLIVMGTALASISVTLLVLRGLAEVTTVSEFALNVVTLLGLGLTVDYALLIIWRYREDGDLARARRTVLISGTAISLSLAALIVIGEPLLAAMALGGLAAAVVATLAALTLVPVLTAMGAKGIEPAAKPQLALMSRLAAFALNKPGPVAFVSAAVLLLMALPFLGVSVHGTDARVLPASSEARQVHDEVLNTFRHGRPEPVIVIVERDATGAEMRDYLNKLNQLDGVARMEPRIDMPPNVTVIDLTPDSEEVAQDVVRAARAVPVNAGVLVGGIAAEALDHQESVLSKLPVLLAVLFAVMVGLLYFLTGSLVIPVKAFVLNLLPLAASLGILTLVFGSLDMTTPVLLFVFIFGLSMDYEVFLLSRITEEYSSTKDNDSAILRGIAGTGAVVTAAAACLIVVFLGFLLGELAPVQEIGLGMTVALIIDVTIVRGLLLPSVMKLLGGWNWWPGSRSVGGHDLR